MTSSARIPALLAACCGGALVFAAAIPAASATVNPRSVLAADDRPTTRVVGGIDADRSQTPWFLQFVPKNRDGGASLCGATKIKKRWAVTAAHCVSSPSGIAKVGKGKSYVLANPATRNQGTRYYLDSIVVHPKYDPKSSTDFHDIALLRTSQKMPSGTLKPNSNKSETSAGTASSVFGFGERIAGDPSSIANVLQEGNVQDLIGPSDPKCGSYGPNYTATYELCAGLPQGGIDACQGDSGGPLIAAIDGQVRLTGIVSSGYGCALPNYPGLYTRVSTYATWMSKYTNGKFKITSSCNGYSCRVKRGNCAKIKLKNLTSKKGSYKIRTNKNYVSLTNARGVVRGGASVKAKIRVTTKKNVCVKVKVKANGTPLKKYKISTNGRRNC